MPTYDYHCESCGKNFEWFQSIKDEKLTLCPEQICPMPEKGKGITHRKISGGAGLIFNGDGFYLTDYVKNSGTSSKKGEGKSNAPAASSEKTSGESSGAGASAPPAASDS